MTDSSRADRAHIRIGNRLFEAILDSTMSDRQKVICYGLLRVTAGWNQRSATITIDDLAEACGNGARGERVGGAFRDAFAELRHENVILTVDEGPGKPKSYGLNADFEEWGRFSVAPNRIRRLFGQRMPNVDAALPEVARPQATVGPPTGHPNEEGWPTDRPTPGLPTGQPTGSNPANHNDLGPRKDIEIHKESTRERREVEVSGGPPAGHPPSGLHARRLAQSELESAYDSERSDAAESWARDPLNAIALKAIEDQANSSIPPGMPVFVRRRSFEAERTRLIAELLHFPTFSAWKSANSAV